MISRQGRECFVYITLPGETRAVAAARFVQEVDSRGVTLGRLIYGQSYLSRPEAVPIDPLVLPLSPGPFETQLFNGMFGALRDAGPDAWGRRLIERHAGVGQLDEIDYLLNSPDDSAGALGFGLNREPPAPLRHFNQTLDLARLQAVADAILAQDRNEPNAVSVQIEDLLLIGTSMGGARPKAVVEDQDALWLAKFNRSDDRWNSARVEHAMLTLAQRCGLTTAESRIETVAGQDVLLVKRFDRERAGDGYTRARMLSALTLLQADESPQDRTRWSYPLLAEEIRRLCAEPGRQARELFRRMVFNALISNLDDHPRNHAVIARSRDWSLSPAYDLTPSTPISQEHRDLAMTVGSQGRRAQAANLLSQCRRFLLDPEDATALIATMARQVTTLWHDTAREVGVSERDCGLIQGAFVYRGFHSGSPDAKS